MILSPETQQLLTALAGGAGMVGLWRLIQFIIGRWYDERKQQSGDDADIRRSQAERITALETQVNALQSELRKVESEASQLRETVRWLTQTCRPRGPELGGGGAT